MENSLPQAYEDSRQAVNDYLAYISRRVDGQQEKEDYLLNSVMENIDGVGTVAAMAAKEAMVSHNSIFQMLHLINEAQGALIDLFIDQRVSGGGSGTADGLSTASSLITIAGNINPYAKAALIIAGLFGSKLDGSEEVKQGELTHPNSLTNKALEASAEAEKLINQAYYSLNPAPNPLMNGPGMVQKGIKFEDLPFVQTPGDAFAVVSAINEANNYLEATRQRASRSNLYEGFDAEYNDTPDISNLMKYDIIHGIIKQQPQSVQVVAQPASTSVAPEQTINFNIQNDFNGNWQDRRGLDDIGEYLARQVKDRLNSGAPLFSGN